MRTGISVRMGELSLVVESMISHLDCKLTLGEPECGSNCLAEGKELLGCIKEKKEGKESKEVGETSKLGAYEMQHFPPCDDKLSQGLLKNTK